MEILDWVILVGILLLIFWAKFYHPEVYTPVMNAIDSIAKSAMGVIGTWISGATANAGADINTTNNGGGG